jgi:hypothetical protein
MSSGKTFRVDESYWVWWSCVLETRDPGAMERVAARIRKLLGAGDLLPVHPDDAARGMLRIGYRFDGPRASCVAGVVEAHLEIEPASAERGGVSHSLGRPTTLELARLLNEVVVSGDRIGSAYHDDEEEAARAWLAYCREIDFWRRAAALRRDTFDALWPHAPAEDDASVIAQDESVEAELAARYWRPSP